MTKKVKHKRAPFRDLQCGRTKRQASRQSVSVVLTRIAPHGIHPSSALTRTRHKETLMEATCGGGKAAVTRLWLEVSSRAALSMSPSSEVRKATQRPELSGLSGLYSDRALSVLSAGYPEQNCLTPSSHYMVLDSCGKIPGLRVHSTS